MIFNLNIDLTYSVKLWGVIMTNSNIFRAYDIRGTFNFDLFPKDAYEIGNVFAQLVKEVEFGCDIAVAMDGRLSSPLLKKHLIEGLISAGAKVTDYGILPTPILYYCVINCKFNAGIMITGSHNPINDNGFKLMFSKLPCFGDDIQKIRENINKKEFQKLTSRFSLEVKDVKNNYTNFMKEIVKLPDNYKVAWDLSNGAACVMLHQLTDLIGGQHFFINDKLDGNFPGHDPDPTIAANLKSLIRCVQDNQCDVGIAFDGDADRICVIDNEGKIVPGDSLLMLFAENILKFNQNAKIIADVKTSQLFFDYVNELGGKAIIWKTGHSFIKTKMHEEKAIFAGEASGHLFFADKYFGFDDAIYAALRLFDILINNNDNLSCMLSKLPNSSATIEAKINCSDERKFAIIESIKHNLQNEDFIAIDGIRKKINNGWWLARASNTQPVITVRCEACSQEELSIVINDLNYHLKTHGLQFLEMI